MEDRECAVDCETAGSGEMALGDMMTIEVVS